MHSESRNSTAAADAAVYDRFASFYHRHWSDHFHPWAVELVDRLIVPEISSGSMVLDVCCGTGKLAGELAKRGYSVTGLDASREMLRFGKLHAPDSLFVCADARSFAFRPCFQLILAMFDSMNHILSAGDLLKVFENARRSLQPGGRFVFDALLEEAYIRDWTQSCTILGEDHACFVRGGFDAASRLGHTEVTLFQRDNAGWQRSDARFFERCYEPQDLSSLLHEAGFRDVREINPRSDLGISGDFSEGRVVFSAAC